MLQNHAAWVMGLGWGRCRDCREQNMGCSAKPRARKVTCLNWPAPPYAYACGCVLAYADKRLTIKGL